MVVQTYLPQADFCCFQGTLKIGNLEVVPDNNGIGSQVLINGLPVKAVRVRITMEAGGPCRATVEFFPSESPGGE